MGDHALLSASSSHRWLECPPSARLCSGKEDRASPYAKEGTDCHELCAYLVEKSLGRDVTDPTENLEYYDSQMQECAESYRDFVVEQIEAIKRNCPDPLVLIEQRLDFSNWVKDGFGTGDCLIVSDGLLSVIDYKHGLGVLVSANNNPQLMCYALGALNLFDGLYDIEKVSMTIFQPRRDNVSTFTMSKDDLLLWADDVLRPTAKLAYDGKGQFKAGEHCQFCKVKASCRKRAEHNLELAKYDFEPPATLDDSEIEDILHRVDDLVSWASDVKDYALRRALSGTHYDGFKVVEGRSVRKFCDEKVVAEAAIAAGFDPFEKKLLGITAMTSLMGKKKFEDVLGSFVIRPRGKPTLVAIEDKRPEMNTAYDDFIEN